jgi:hypothetical protein
MKVLVACEFSGRVRDAFLAKGHEAVSCDILPSEAPGPHIQGDVLPLLARGWDLLVAHPPCTYLSFAAMRVWNKPGRAEKRDEAARFFMALMNAPIPRICVENPLGEMGRRYRKPDQIVHPYYFGDPFQKRTCFWLKNLPLLVPTHMLPKPEPLYICQGAKSKGKAIGWCEGMRGQGNRAHARSRTFPGIATAMADQWGNNGQSLLS